jgi:ATP-binding cassette subfamily F protein 3
MSRVQKIAFVGPNGAGKTTLAKIIAGIISFNSGKRIVGHNTIISHYAQDIADNLNPNLDIIETLENISKNLTIGQLRSLLGAFLFSGDDVFKKIVVLSGGEKSRVALAKILLTKSNLIILDEPTNHLDIESKQVLQNALRDFEGSLVIVSHDVDFLSPIVNKVVEIKKGELKIFYGGIEYYLEKHEQLLLDQEIIEEDKLNKSENFSRRDQKRAEAELRQKKYTATKDILRRIKQLEDEIEKLEEIHKKLEEDLLNPEIYNNPKIVKDKNIELNNIKEKLDAKISEWSIASEEYTEIEKQFDK